ncbi:hypothetical protein OBFLKGFO_02726 [Mannheimia haemolytica]
MHSILKKILGKSKSSSQSSVKSDNVFAIEQDSVRAGYIRKMPPNYLIRNYAKKYLGLLWQQVSMNRQMFEALYQQPIERYAEMVQLLPASESHHHSHIGGMLDHGLEVIVLFQPKSVKTIYCHRMSHLKNNLSNETLGLPLQFILPWFMILAKLWLILKSLLKTALVGFAWNGQPPQPYKFKYIKGRDYHLHPVLRRIPCKSAHSQVCCV